MVWQASFSMAASCAGSLDESVGGSAVHREGI